MVSPSHGFRARVYNPRMTDPADNLETYLVGGAVRDRLLGIEVQDRDWVVVGATAEAMLERGFTPVGDDFPVFLHPRSGEQYALARQERKTARGYRGFTVNSDPGITLQQDLQRRDLTINAIAMDAAGNLIDPFGGARDLERRLLRHISPAFAEDPVRVLRVARFRARFAGRGFTVHAGTRRLMARMVEAGEVDALQPQRVWQELHGALLQPATAAFIEELRACGALAKILPEVDALFGVPQPAEYHPEIDTGRHTLLTLDAAHRLSDDPRVIFAALVHDLGKALTPRAQWPSHRGHERRGLAAVAAVCERLHAPSKYRKLALTVCEFHLHHHRLRELKPATALDLLEKLDAFRQPENARLFALACTADLRGRTGMQDIDCPQAALLAEYHRAALAVDAGAVAAEVAGDSADDSADSSADNLADNSTVAPDRRAGAKIKQQLRRRRIAAIAAVKSRTAEAAAAA